VDSVDISINEQYTMGNTQESVRTYCYWQKEKYTIHYVYFHL